MQFRMNILVIFSHIIIIIIISIIIIIIYTIMLCYQLCIYVNWWDLVGKTYWNIKVY